jgi:TRAP-type mannitol/chloroaromatic compound transport system permease small subunit
MWNVFNVLLILLHVYHLIKDLHVKLDIIYLIINAKNVLTLQRFVLLQITFNNVFLDFTVNQFLDKMCNVCHVVSRIMF